MRAVLLCGRCAVVRSAFSETDCWKAHEICYKAQQHYPSHLRHVATLPSEIRDSNFLQMSFQHRICSLCGFGTYMLDFVDFNFSHVDFGN